MNNEIDGADAEWLNAKASAEFIRVSKDSFRFMKIAGELPQPVRIHKRDYWLRSSLKKWLKEKENPHENNNRES